MELNRNKINIDINKPHALTKFSENFCGILKEYWDSSKSDIIILCIGTDRATGDCLGPLVGHKLKLIKYRDVYIYGTLDEPVHAQNIEQKLESIYSSYKDPFIVAIDASLGSIDRIGCISMGVGPLSPGSGVYKKLPNVGDMHVIGIVNMSGFMELLLLQNTRLSLVMKMADTISNGIHYALWKVIVDKKTKQY